MVLMAGMILIVCDECALKFHKKLVPLSMSLPICCQDISHSENNIYVYFKNSNVHHDN